MMPFNADRRTQRLLGAAASLLKAMASRQGVTALVTARVDGVLVNTAHWGCNFTLREYIDAMSMIIRLGNASSHPGPIAATPQTHFHQSSTKQVAGTGSRKSNARRTALSTHGITMN